MLKNNILTTIIFTMFNSFSSLALAENCIETLLTEGKLKIESSFNYEAKDMTLSFQGVNTKGHKIYDESTFLDTSKDRFANFLVEHCPSGSFAQYQEMADKLWTGFRWFLEKQDKDTKARIVACTPKPGFKLLVTHPELSYALYFSKLEDAYEAINQ